MEVLVGLAIVVAVIWAISRAVSASRRNMPGATDPGASSVAFPEPRSSGRRRSNGIRVREPDPESGKRYFEVGDDFFCDVSASPDGRYLVGAADRSGGRGACVLLDAHSTQVLFRASIARPNNPHVSNDGLVVVEDWKDSQLSGALVGFNKDGTRLWTKSFRANIFTSGLAADGAHAFVSTANSDYEAHSGKTFYIDTTTGEIRWKADGWQDIQFDGNVLTVGVRTANGSTATFAFDDQGALPADFDAAIAEAEESRCRGRYWWVLPKVEEALKTSPPNVDDAQRLLDGLTQDENEVTAANRARVLRFRGEIAAARGDSQAAITLWQQAMAMDPKVGIKRRLDAVLSGAADPGLAPRAAPRRSPRAVPTPPAKEDRADHPARASLPATKRRPVPAQDAFHPEYAPIGRTDPTCPYCGSALAKRLSRRKPCPSCGELICVKTRPGDREQVMVTEEEFDAVEAQWKLHEYFRGMSDDDRRAYNAERQTLRSRFGREPGHYDVRWSLLNGELVEHASVGDLGLYTSTKSHMAAVLEEEGRLRDALDAYLEVAGLDLNGATNTSGHRNDPQLMAEFPAFQPSMSFLAPGIASTVEWIREKTGASEAEVHDRFLDVYQSRVMGLKVPLTPEQAWKRFVKASKET